MPISPSAHFNLRNIYARKVILIFCLAIPRTQAPGAEGGNTAQKHTTLFAPLELGLAARALASQNARTQLRGMLAAAR